MRHDGYTNLMNKYGTSRDNSTAYEYRSDGLIPDMLLSQHYETNGLFTKIIDLPAEEAVKHGFELNIKNQEATDYITNCLDRLDWEDNAAAAIKWARLFGGALAVMLIDDGNGIDEPLDFGNIRSVEEIIVYDRSIVTPDYTNLYAFNKKSGINLKFGKPEYYNVFSLSGSFIVHESRCLIFGNGILPELTMQSIYRYWGIPELTRIKKELREATTSHGYSVQMLERSVQAIYTMKELANNLTSENGEEQVLKRLQAIDAARNILNSIAIDEGESYEFKSAPVAGVKEILDGACNMLSAVTNIPQTLLFGRSPAGMNATGESDLENYYNYVEHIQKLMLRKNMRRLLDIIVKAGLAGGELDEDPRYKLEFNPLWSMSESEQADVDQKKAQTEQIRAQTAQIYVEMGALDPSEVRRGLAKQEAFDIETLLDDMSDDEIDDFMPESQEDYSEDALTDDEKDGIINMDDDDWVTIKGTHVQVGEGGELRGSVGEKISSSSKKYQQKNSEVKSEPSTSTPTSQNSNAPKTETLSTTPPSVSAESSGEEPAATMEAQAGGTRSNSMQAEHISGADYFKDAKTEAEGADILAKNLSESSGEQVTQEQAMKMWDAAISYTGGDYNNIRQAQMMSKSGTKEYLEKGRQVEEFLRLSPKWAGGELYRGINVDESIAADIISKAQTGEPINMMGISSWSSEVRVADGFAKMNMDDNPKNRNIVFKLPKTKTGASITHLSSLGTSESEVTLPSTSAFTVKGVKDRKTKKGKITEIELEEI